MYSLKITPQARENLDKVEAEAFEEIRKKLLSLRQNPRPAQAEELTEAAGFRIKVGSTRILYRIDEAKKEIIIY